MNAIAAHLEKLKDYIFILLVTGLKSFTGVST